MTGGNRPLHRNHFERRFTVILLKSILRLDKLDTCLAISDYGVNFFFSAEEHVREVSPCGYDVYLHRT